ncbi:Hypothetical predicted protein [Lecanosticta acicola]|uniref:Pentatricopeptide repeat protein n=1 Tax=Lecanosticta acicola TaxID=111012 RepID=A0AAI8YVJ4_9PEZI|nr:Hypothetical predicted protein [Lecanosticta acicola]
MLECRACVLRCIRTIVGDALSPQRPLVLTPRIESYNYPLRRRLATRARPTPQKPPIDFDADERFADNEPELSASRRAGGKALTKANERALRKEIAWLRDPVKFANHVHYILRNEQPDKALELCRLASKEGNVVVAWNHVVNWHIQRRKVNRALEIYNEMKKRGQFPDAFTYMMIFRGWGSYNAMTDNSRDLYTYMLKAINIYHSMSSPTSRVKPNIKHTNAVLRLCALAHDLDAMWGVASKIPEHGSGSADNVTYTILLSAIRTGAFGGNEGRHEENEHVLLEQLEPKKKQAVDEGRRIWQEVIARWRSGEIQIDEALVCAMAKLLLFGSELQDWDDVLSLVQQTTRVERQLPELGSPDRYTSHVPLGNAQEPQLTADEDANGWVPTPARNAFKAISPHAQDSERPRRAMNFVWVTPGKYMLDVLIRACTNLRSPKAAAAYWEKLTGEYDVQPDLTSYEEMLRLLSINRGSAAALRLLKEMAEVGVAPSRITYRIAMGCCMRDWKNHNVVKTASEMIDSMEHHLRFPDSRTLESYLVLALKTRDAEMIVAALSRMENIAQLMWSKIGSSGSQPRAGRVSENVDDAAAFFKKLVAGIDTFMYMEELAQEDREKWNLRRSKINGYLGRLINNAPVKKDRSSRRRAQLYETAVDAFREAGDVHEAAGNVWRRHMVL